MRGSLFYPQVPEVRMGQLHLRAEDNPDSEEPRSSLRCGFCSQKVCSAKPQAGQEKRLILCQAQTTNPKNCCEN